MLSGWSSAPNGIRCARRCLAVSAFSNPSTPAERDGGPAGAFRELPNKRPFSGVKKRTIRSRRSRWGPAGRAL